MKKTFYINGKQKITLTDANYIGGGGEGNVYKKDKIAYKIFNNVDRAISLSKIEELKKIKNKNVLIPQNALYDQHGIITGYSMPFRSNLEPICKLFTKSFKQRNSIDRKQLIDLTEKMQKILLNIHDAKCLVVDYNELNILFHKKKNIPFYIDTDSYQTPSFKATAIMNSIKDPLVKNNNWNEGSDWFSFAVIMFQLFINIHPFKGKHPDYKSKEWGLRMDKGISVFDPKVTLPRTCCDLSVIPKSHLGWFKDVFVNNARCAPPVMGDTLVIAVPQAFKFVTASKSFDINLVETCLEDIKDVYDFMGINYIIGETNIHKGRAIIPVKISDADKVLMCESQGVDPVICVLKDENVTFYNEGGQEFGSIASKDMMSRNGCIYTVYGGNMMENSFTRIGDKLIHSCRQTATVMDLTTQVFDGVVIQDMLGKKYMTMPYGKGVCTNLPIKDLDGYRVLGARSERNICGVMAEKAGKYYRFVFTFDDAYTKYMVRVEKDVPYADINLTVLPNGVAVLANDNDVEVFKGANVKVIDSPPFNSTTKVYNSSGLIHYIDGKDLFTAKMK